MVELAFPNPRAQLPPPGLSLHLGEGYKIPAGPPFLFILNFPVHRSRAFQAHSLLIRKLAKCPALLLLSNCLRVLEFRVSHLPRHSPSQRPRVVIYSARHHHIFLCKMKMSASGVVAAAAGSASASRASEKRFRVFAVDRTQRWPVQGWSSGDESAVALDEQFVAEESARAFAVDKESRWPLQGWCQPHKPYNTLGDDSANMSNMRPSVPSRWPQGF